MSTFGWTTGSTSTSSSSTTGYYYKRKVGVIKSDERRPLADLKRKEESLKLEEEDGSSGMPKEQILFDPKELVLGGKK